MSSPSSPESWHGTELVERDDGLYGDFKVTASQFGDHALAKLADGEWRGVSVSTRAPFNHRMDGDVKVRTLATLDHVLLTDDAQIPGSQVLAVRDDPTSFLHHWTRKYPLVSS